MDTAKIFYEKIVPEAALGKIRAPFMMAVAFGTKIVEENKEYPYSINVDDTIIPTLIIKNKEIFDDLLDEYVEKALRFYNTNLMDSDNSNVHEKENELINMKKLLIAQLFANATTEDFSNPIMFLRKRIAFIDNHVDKHFNLGYSKMLLANLELFIFSDNINNETPSQLAIRATDGKDKWISPRVKFGICDDTVYIYAIQNTDKNEGALAKKINRKLYKIGEGFTDQHLLENPKDITASFLVVLNMAISYFNILGYEKIVMPSLLPVRWNAKKIVLANSFKKQRVNNQQLTMLTSELDIVQNNLTNKLIRTVLRLACHYNNLEITAFPYESDSSLHVLINNDIPVICNNSLLEETANMVNTVTSERNR